MVRTVCRVKGEVKCPKGCKIHQAPNLDVAGQAYHSREKNVRWIVRGNTIVPTVPGSTIFEFSLIKLYYKW